MAKRLKKKCTFTPLKYEWSETCVSMRLQGRDEAEQNPHSG